MYAVVGCTDCHALWLLSDPGSAETATCPRCGRRHRTGKLKRLFTAEDREAAREARASMLADAADATGASVPSDAETDAPVVDDDEYLDAAGVDADAVAAAGERSDRRPRSRSRPDVVRDALRELEAPDERDVVAYAAAHGVPEDAAADLLDRLVQRGEATAHGGTYRLL
jgi:hypothetical protein